MALRFLDPRKMVVLVTGATAGFGKATAQRFAKAGAKIIATGRRGGRLAALQQELGGPGRVHTVQADVADIEAMSGALEALPPAFRAVDVLVNNAGLGLGLSPAHECDLDAWLRMIDTNVKGLVATTHMVLPGMVERDRGHIINLGSVAGNYPYKGGNVYGGTKAFVRTFSLNLRADLVGTRVRVTNLEPGMCETEFSEVRFGGDKGKAKSVYEGMDPITSADMAETIFWCATLPAHVNVNTMELMPVQQAFAGFAVARRPSGGASK